MRVGLISDTHLEDGEPLPPLVYEAFGEVDLIMHTGDFDALSVIDLLERIAPVVAVRGYTDPVSPERGLQELLVHSLDGWRVGMVHDIAHPAYYIRAIGTSATLQFPATPLPEVLKIRFGQLLDAVVFGDTHAPLILEREGVLLMNSGSPTRPHLPGRASPPGTVGLLEVQPDVVRARVVSLERGLPALLEGEIGRIAQKPRNKRAP